MIQLGNYKTSDMKKLLACGVITMLLVACGNDATRTGAVKDTAKTEENYLKTQSNSSLTDTSYNIGDSLR